jgi:hypothetical protein
MTGFVRRSSIECGISQQQVAGVVFEYALVGRTFRAPRTGVGLRTPEPAIRGWPNGYSFVCCGTCCAMKDLYHSKLAFGIRSNLA